MRRSLSVRIIVLGGPIVFAGLFMGTVGAQADDLSGLPHPDKALQQKLDLLDHGSDTPAAPLSPEVDQGSFPRSVRIPGTNTSIRVYGEGTETLRYSH